MPSKPEPPLSITFGDRHVVAVLASIATTLFAFASRLRLNEKPWGDEPHYMIMSIALGKYHTFDLTKAYANGDYLAFYPEAIDAHVVHAANGTTVPFHNFGGPLLWTGPFMLWGRAGVAAVMVLVSVLIVVNVYYLLRELGIVRAYAGLVTGLFVIGSPLYMYASMQFVEPIGALLVLFAVRTVLNPAPSAVRVAFTSAALGYLPWIHGRFILMSVILGGLLIARVDRAAGRRAVHSYLPAVAPMALLILALELFNLTRYGTLSPAPGNTDYGDGVFQIPVQTGLAYLAFDRQYGLLTHFPLLALAVAGLLLAWRRRLLPTHVVLLATAVPYVLAVSTFRYWWAGFSPPGRYLMVVTPLLAYYVAVVLQRLHSWTVTTLATLAALAGFAVAATGDMFITARFVTSGGPGVDPILNHLATLLHLEGFPDLIPSGVAEAPPNQIGFLSWFLALMMFALVVWRIGRRRPEGRVPLPSIGSLIPAGRGARPPATGDGAEPAGDGAGPAGDGAESGKRSGGPGVRSDGDG